MLDKLEKIGFQILVPIMPPGKNRGELGGVFEGRRKSAGRNASTRVLFSSETGFARTGQQQRKFANRPSSLLAYERLLLQDRDKKDLGT